MKYLVFVVLLLAGCATAPELTSVINAPVRVSCVVSVSATPKLLTPCAPDAASDLCLTDYIVDHATLLGYVSKLATQLKACI